MGEITKMNRRTQVWLLALLFFVSLGVGTQASHQWGSYKFEDSTVRYYWSQSGFQSHFEKEGITDSDSWHNASEINLQYPYTHWFGCFDMVGGFATSAGQTGWAGLTTLDCLSGSTILSATSVINITYAQNYSSEDVDKIACHELGHAFGLQHDDVSGGTCMTPVATSGVANPSAHDIEMLDSIY